MTLCGHRDYPVVSFLSALIHVCDGCQMVISKLFANYGKAVIFSRPVHYFGLAKEIVTLRREFLEKVEKRLE